jgi:hypothetical protein
LYRRRGTTTTGGRGRGPGSIALRLDRGRNLGYAAEVE